MKRSFLLLLVYVLFLPSSWAQAHKDCIDAREICSKGSLQISLEDGAGNFMTEIENSCDNLTTNLRTTEHHSYWMTWEIAQAGDLVFTISPNNEMDDYDFILYRVTGSAPCTDRETIRCMYAGESIGRPAEENEACIGPTGLQQGETDLFERPGCLGTSNNFLAPLTAETGDRYILVIDAFENEGGGFTIDFCGSAQLGCDSVTCLLTSIPTVPKALPLQLYPNPTYGWTQIELSNKATTTGELLLSNLHGQILKREKLALIEGKARYELPFLSTSGWYTLQLITDEQRYVGKVFYLHP